jgi:hypothetical protein
MTPLYIVLACCLVCVVSIAALLLAIWASGWQPDL